MLIAPPLSLSPYLLFACLIWLLILQCGQVRLISIKLCTSHIIFICQLLTIRFEPSILFAIVRALQGDLIPKSQQQSLQSASIVLGSFGDLAASALVNSFDQPVTHIRLCFFIACAVYVPAVLSLLVLGKEKPMSPDDPHLKDAQRQSLNIFSYLQGLPSWMWRLGTTYSFGFFTLFCVQPYISGWLGSSVLGGK